MFYGARLAQYESEEVLGSRTATTQSRSAFGARHFQPHMTVLEPSKGDPSDLTPMGTSLRGTLSNLTFDEFLIDVKQRGGMIQNW